MKKKNRRLFIVILVALIAGIAVGLLIDFFFPLDIQSGINL